MPELLRTCFSLLVLTAVVHTGLSWALLIAVRRDAAARTELFGSIKTLVLGPKALRLKHIFSRSLPAVLESHTGPVRIAYSLSKWSGWVATAMLLVVVSLLLYAWLTIKNDWIDDRGF